MAKSAFTSLRDGASETAATIKFVSASNNDKKLRLIVTFNGTDRETCYVFKETYNLSGCKPGMKCDFMLEPSKDGEFINVIALSPRD